MRVLWHEEVEYDKSEQFVKEQEDPEYELWNELIKMLWSEVTPVAF